MLKPAKTSLQGRTIDILNIIRNNASAEYQSAIPEISDVSDIPAVGQAIVGNPTRSNEFIDALVNRIALVMIRSATFRNPFEMLKKGYLEFGESVEEIFIAMADVYEYSAEKAAAREFKRYTPKTASAFHLLNWKVMYPITIQRETLKQAFLSVQGVEDMITRIIDSIYTAAAYDEFLLFKYLIIKGVTKGQIKPSAFDPSDLKNAAIAFRGTSNAFTFVSPDNNFAHVRNNCPKERQYIFMDSDFNATFDVGVLAEAFNMEKADFMGRLLLVDKWTEFDNERWAVIRENSDMVEEVTSTELTLMGNVKAVLVDEEFFQVYDSVSEMADQRVSSGLYWNYFYHNWKIVSVSPYHNAVAFVATSVSAITSMDFIVTGIVQGEESTIYLLEQDPASALKDQSFVFIQDEDNTEYGIAINKYGAITVPADFDDEEALTLNLQVVGAGGAAATFEGTLQIAAHASEGVDDEAIPAVAIGDKITFAAGN